MNQFHYILVSPNLILSLILHPLLHYPKTGFNHFKDGSWKEYEVTVRAQSFNYVSLFCSFISKVGGRGSAVKKSLLEIKKGFTPLKRAAYKTNCCRKPEMTTRLGGQEPQNIQRAWEKARNKVASKCWRDVRSDQRRAGEMSESLMKLWWGRKVKTQTVVERRPCKKHKKYQQLQPRKVTGDYWKIGEEIGAWINSLNPHKDP